MSLQGWVDGDKGQSLEGVTARHVETELSISVAITADLQRRRKNMVQEARQLPSGYHPNHGDLLHEHKTTVYTLWQVHW